MTNRFYCITFEYIIYLLSLFEVFFQCCTEFLWIFNKLFFSLFHRLLARRARYKTDHFIHRIKQFFDGTCYLSKMIKNPRQKSISNVINLQISRDNVCIITHNNKIKRRSYLIVSKNVLRSLISSGIRLKIRLSEADFLFNSWKASSERFKRYSTTANETKIKAKKLIIFLKRKNRNFLRRKKN